MNLLGRQFNLAGITDHGCRFGQSRVRDLSRTHNYLGPILGNSIFCEGCVYRFTFGKLVGCFFRRQPCA